MKYRIAIQVSGGVSGLVTPDRGFAEDVLDRLVGASGVEWISFEASASGVFTPLEEGSAAIAERPSTGFDDDHATVAKDLVIPGQLDWITGQVAS